MMQDLHRIGEHRQHLAMKWLSEDAFEQPQDRRLLVGLKEIHYFFKSNPLHHQSDRSSLSCEECCESFDCER